MGYWERIWERDCYEDRVDCCWIDIGKQWGSSIFVRWEGERGGVAAVLGEVLVVYILFSKVE